MTKSNTDTFAEKDTAIVYAQAWNTIDCSGFIKLLADDTYYASQYVLDEITSKSAILEYFQNKIDVVRESTDDSKVYAELGYSRSSFPGRDCVIIAREMKITSKV